MVNVARFREGRWRLKIAPKLHRIGRAKHDVPAQSLLQSNVQGRLKFQRQFAGTSSNDLILCERTGTRDVALTDLYANDGMHYLTRHADEILTTVTLPRAVGWRSTYWKLRRRGSFDFPVAAVAAAARFDGDRIMEARIVLGAVASRPLEVPAAAARLAGQSLTDDLIASVADDAYTLAKPMDNTDFARHARHSHATPCS